MTYWPTWKRVKSAGWKVRTQLNRFAACVCECTARTAAHYSRPAYPAWLHCWQLLGAVRKAFVCITAESPWCTSCLLKNPGDSSGLINFSEERTWRHRLKNDAPLSVICALRILQSTVLNGAPTESWLRPEQSTSPDALSVITWTEGWWNTGSDRSWIQGHWGSRALRSLQWCSEKFAL